jgi:replicative DNA helicase
MVGNACAISMPYIDRNGQIVMRGDINGSDYQKVLFVATEMTADEIQTLILAYVSGVNEKTILLGNYTPDEFDRVKQALDIIDKYGQNFIIECIPDPSIAMIKARLTKYIVQDEVEYIFYDYIFTSPSLITEFASADVKEYVALMMLSNTLKEVAMNYKVFIQSATQLNDGWSKKEIGLRDQNCLRGSKAIADKIDIGLIGVRLNEEERKQIDAIWTELKKQNPGKYRNEPNIVIDIYKNRRGELNCVKIFRYFDYGTCHCEDLFVTDPSYQAVNEIGDLKFEKHAYDFLDLKTRGIV